MFGKVGQSLTVCAGLGTDESVSEALGKKPATYVLPRTLGYSRPLHASALHHARNVTASASRSCHADSGTEAM